MKKVVHQIYWDFNNDGVKLEDIKQFYNPVQKTKKHCKKYGIQHKMWNLKNCEDFLKKYFKDYLKLWKDFKYPIQRADFIRYCIMYKYGGIYIDCDIYPLKNINHLFNKDYFFVKRQESGPGSFPYNAIIGSEPGQEIFKKIMKHCKESTYEKQGKKIYDSWKGRLVFQTTGQYMLKRVLGKDKNILNILCIKNKKKNIDQCAKGALFMDFNESVWYQDMVKPKNSNSKRITKRITKRTKNSKRLKKRSKRLKRSNKRLKRSNKRTRRV